MYKLRQWFLKTFKRNEIIRLIFTGEDKRIHTSFIIPDGDSITYNGNTFILIPELVYMLEGLPTIYANYKTAELIDIYNTTETRYTPKMFNLAIEANVADQLYRASKKSKLDDMLPILLLLVIGAVGYSIYLSGQNFTEIMERLPEIVPVVTGG